MTYFFNFSAFNVVSQLGYISAFPSLPMESTRETFDDAGTGSGARPSAAGA